jgi:FkbM family methyltransferase
LRSAVRRAVGRGQPPAAAPRVAEPRWDYGPLPVLRAVIAYNEHGAYCVPLAARHRPAAGRVVNGNVWEAETIDAIVARCGTGDVVHAGTFFGDFLPAISRGCADGARVWAFEPNPESHRCAQITTQLNGLTNVTLTHAALGASSGEASMKTSDDGRALGGASHIVGDGSGTEQVPLVALDDVIPPDRDVSIIQLDVEGYELEALRGATGTIQRCSPLLMLESVPADPWFAALGYRPAEKVGGNTVFSRG